MKHRVCSMLLALCCLLLLLTGCGKTEDAAPWIADGKGDLPLSWMEIYVCGGKLQGIWYTLREADGTDSTWKYTEETGPVQIETRERKRTSQLTLRTVQPILEKLVSSMPEEYQNGDEYDITFHVEPILVRADVGGHPIDLVYSLSSGEFTELGGAEYTGADDQGILNMVARVGQETQNRWLVIDN